MRTPTRPTVRRFVQLPAALGLACASLGGAAAGQAPAGSHGVPAAAPGAAKGAVVTEVSRACWYVFQAKNGDYWFGSDGQGVYRWDGKTLVNYTTADGLSGNSIRGIQGDKAGNVFFTTFDGICKFDGRVFRTLPVEETPADGGWRLHPDDLWFQWFKGMSCLMKSWAGQFFQPSRYSHIWPKHCGQSGFYWQVRIGVFTRIP